MYFSWQYFLIVLLLPRKLIKWTHISSFICPFASPIPVSDIYFTQMIILSDFFAKLHLKSSPLTEIWSSLRYSHLRGEFSSTFYWFICLLLCLKRPPCWWVSPSCWISVSAISRQLWSGRCASRTVRPKTREFLSTFGNMQPYWCHLETAAWSVSAFQVRNRLFSPAEHRAQGTSPP